MCEKKPARDLCALVETIIPDEISNISGALARSLSNTSMRCSRLYPRAIVFFFLVPLYSNNTGMNERFSDLHGDECACAFLRKFKFDRRVSLCPRAEWLQIQNAIPFVRYLKYCSVGGTACSFSSPGSN